MTGSQTYFRNVEMIWLNFTLIREQILDILNKVKKITAFSIKTKVFFFHRNFEYRYTEISLLFSDNLAAIFEPFGYKQSL